MRSEQPARVERDQVENSVPASAQLFARRADTCVPWLCPASAREPTYAMCCHVGQTFLGQLRALLELSGRTVGAMCR